MDCRVTNLLTISLLTLGALIPGDAEAAPWHVPGYCVPTPCPAPCPVPYGGVEPMPSAPSPGGEQFPSSPIDLGESAPAQSGNTFAVNASPNMIGDLLNNSDFVFDPLGPGNPNHGRSSIAIAGGDRRFKISENMSPVPRDRLFYAFNGFQQAARTHDGRVIDVNRHTLGGEKTFWNGGGSLEFRMPILQGLSATQTADGDLYNDDGVEFGNATLIPKFIVTEGTNFLVSTGLGINLPTARDANFSDPNLAPQPFLSVHNQAVYLSPFLGLLWTPSEVTYVISYCQLDFAANGNTFFDSAGDQIGTLRDQNLLHFDIAGGRFLYRDYNTRLTGIAAQLELHYTTTIEDAEILAVPLGIVGNPFNRLDFLILTGGFNFEFWNSSWLTVACAVPLRGLQDQASGQHPDRPFDAEIQVLFNRYF